MCIYLYMYIYIYVRGAPFCMEDHLNCFCLDPYLHLVTCRTPSPPQCSRSWSCGSHLFSHCCWYPESSLARECAVRRAECRAPTGSHPEKDKTSHGNLPLIYSIYIYRYRYVDEQIYVYVYIYIQREMYVYISVNIYTHNMYVLYKACRVGLRSRNNGTCLPHTGASLKAARQETDASRHVEIGLSCLWQAACQARFPRAMYGRF